MIKPPFTAESLRVYDSDGLVATANLIRSTDESAPTRTFEEATAVARRVADCLGAMQDIADPGAWRKEQEEAIADVEAYARYAERFGDLSCCYDVDDVTRVISNHVDALRAQRDELLAALKTLRKEAAGLARAHEAAIRADSGNANLRCLEVALEGAMDAIGRTERGE